MADQSWSAASFSQRLCNGDVLESEVQQLPEGQISAVLALLKKVKPPLHETFGVEKIDLRRLNNAQKRSAWLIELRKAGMFLSHLFTRALCVLFCVSSY